MDMKSSTEFGRSASPLAVSIVMPCLNEIQALPHCIANAQEALDRIEQIYGLAGEIVIADNGSTDGSKALATKLGARVVEVARKGYGAAIIGGFEGAYGDFLVMGDCDGSYDFTDCVAMIDRLIDGANLCMGSRFKGGISPGAMPWKNRYIGNPILTGILNLFFQSGIDDAHCGLRAIRRETFETLGLRGSGMEFASEMVIKASLCKMRIDEVPATLSPDIRDRPPHLRPWRDGWRHLRYLLMLSPTWAFGIPALALSTLGIAILAIALLAMLGVVEHSPVGDSWTTIGAMLVGTGHLALVSALAAHLYGVRDGYRQLHPWLLVLRPVLNFEAFLFMGGLAVACSIGSMMIIAGYWSSNAFQALPSVLPVATAGAFSVVGLQTMFGGILLSILCGHEADFLKIADGHSSQPICVPVDRDAARIPAYTMVAVVCAMLHNAVMIGLDQLGVHYAICQVVSAAVLLPTGYFLQTRYAFRVKPSWSNFVRYSGLLLTNFPVAMFLVWLLCGQLSITMVVAAPISTLTLFLWNYATSRWALTGQKVSAHD